MGEVFLHSFQIALSVLAGFHGVDGNRFGPLISRARVSEVLGLTSDSVKMVLMPRARQ